MAVFCSDDDLKLINSIMRDFTNLTTIAAVFVNNRGRVASPEYNFSPFCRAIRKNPTYLKRCNQCDLYGGLEATKTLDSKPYHCHTGLVDFSVPIMKNGSILGFVMAGQARTEDMTLRNILSKQTNWRNDPELVSLYNQQVSLTAEQLYSATKVLRILVNHNFPFKDMIAEEATPTEVPDFINDGHTMGRPEVRKAIMYIEKNLTGKTTLGKIANHVHLSESYFSKIFKEDMGVSVTQYINLLKMQEAKMLLMDNNWSINRISQSLGFTRTSYFCKIFKMATNETPHGYRKKYGKPKK